MGPVVQHLRFVVARFNKDPRGKQPLQTLLEITGQLIRKQQEMKMKRSLYRSRKKKETQVGAVHEWRSVEKKRGN
ncbi:guanosine monophosphate reductase [Sesbania bispinosa]|nr:guanosine monophosphate reductase [Sesbania bispinosa]